ncbi:hypothetical protein SZ64_03910 [Erythrobacter sp. SG61-1L]|uniref:class I adenylate-forming enzyme family protein n=1 Tax=Erythrobacter sp. SG61-1L TaxID=1603897 RepID=UPI0006C90F66|nr:class I adenylate-forming enzyme family protein [Erythrobacter sp. SG61-1L]KPL67320.1 hypothetical protein SZ64_03910 [Erythrobacter sp. SG61-1L]
MPILEPIYTHDRERIAVRAGSALITYGRLCADIDTMAQWLLAQGLEPGDRVTLHPNHLANTSYWDWIMQLGAIRAGLVCSTGGMPPQVAASGAIGPYAAAIGKIDGLPASAHPTHKLPFSPQGTQPLAEQVELPASLRDLTGLEAQSVRLLSTSGTTGTPKVVRWDAKLFAGRLTQVRETGDITPDTVLLTLLGLITTTGLRYPIAAWQIGATVLLAAMGDEQPDFASFVAPSTFIAASPFRMQEILKFVPGQWPDREKRVVELFGGRVAPLLRQRVLARCGSPVRMSYGATEVGRIAAGDSSLVSRNPGAVGMVEPGITVEIVDAEGEVRPAGKPGAVRIKSNYMCDGYLGIPVNNGPRAPFRDGWFYPGDIGILFEDGLFAITGRTSETINIAGAKLSPVALEERLSALPELEDVCVVALQLDQGDVIGVAAVLQPGKDMSAVRLKIRPMLPQQFLFALFNVRFIPRNAMGRIPRQTVAKELTERLRQRQRRRAAQMRSA